MTAVIEVVAIEAGHVGAAAAAIAMVRTAAATTVGAIGFETGAMLHVREGKVASVGRARPVTDAAHGAVAVLAVGLGYFLRTGVPFLNAKARSHEVSPELDFERPLWPRRRPHKASRTIKRTGIANTSNSGM